MSPDGVPNDGPQVFSYLWFMKNFGRLSWLDLRQLRLLDFRWIRMLPTLLVAGGLLLQSANAQQLVINEFMASNSSTHHDEDGDFEDWIEIYNLSDAWVNLSGFGLSDDPDRPFRWIFPGVSVAPGQFLLVWASGKDRRDPSGSLHTNFSISSEGEELLLTDPEGEPVDRLPATRVPTGISFGRNPDGGGTLVFFREPTPGAANATKGYEGVLDAPAFSHQGGFYGKGFELEITSTLPGAVIHYSMDGSRPGEDSPLYEGPLQIDSRKGEPNTISMIPTNAHGSPGPPYFEGWQEPEGEVRKASVVRALAKKDDYIESRVVTQTYFVDEPGTNWYSLPVFSLSTDQENFFDPDIGIYVPGNHGNFSQRGKEWERPVHLAMFEADGSLAFEGDMGVRTHGGTTRSRPRKSLRIYARGEYGDPWINYQLFPEKEVFQYKRFLLRNSGNDWDQSVFRDGFMQYLARDLNVETQYYRPAILFINGEYWGIHNIRDRYDHHYIYSHFGLEEGEVTGLENNAWHDYGSYAGIAHYNAMYDFIAENNMAHEPHMDHVRTLMDTKSFTDQLVANIFIMNTDWPGNNLVYWRRNIETYDPDAPAGMDGRWRWKMLDTDFGFLLNFHYVVGIGQGAAHNTLAHALDPSGPNWPNPPWSTLLFRRLLTNQGFRTGFINRFADLMNTGFHEERVVAVLDSIEYALQPEMAEHIRRWRRPVSMNEWHDNVQVMREFAMERPAHVRQHILAQFQLSGLLELDLGVNDRFGGRIRLNTIVPNLDGRWKGIYFQGVPVTLEPLPARGYRFSHWSGDRSGEEELLILTLHEDTRLTAHFEPDPDYVHAALDPEPYPMQLGPYRFEHWDPSEPEGSFPPHMLFLQSDRDDPGLEHEMTHRYHIPESDYHNDDAGSEGFVYRLTGRSRINGLGSQGISFINTGRGRDLGAAVLALDTRGVQDVEVSWTGGTLIPNARVYAIRLQYRIGLEGQFLDVMDSQGEPVEYMRSDVEGHEWRFDPVALPSLANDHPFVQLRWKYYFTGQRLDANHGRRDMLRLDDILVTASELTTGTANPYNPGVRLLQNAPNPFSGRTRIGFFLPSADRVRIDLFDARGNHRGLLTDRDFAAGEHAIVLEGDNLEAGLYFYRMTTSDFSAVKRLLLVK